MTRVKTTSFLRAQYIRITRISEITAPCKVLLHLFAPILPAELTWLSKLRPTSQAGATLDNKAVSDECDLFTASCKRFLSLFLRQVRTHPALQFPGPMKLQKLPTSCHLKEVRTVGNGIAGAWTPLPGISIYTESNCRKLARAVAIKIAESVDMTLAGPLTLSLDDLRMSRTCQNCDAVQLQRCSDAIFCPPDRVL